MVSINNNSTIRSESGRTPTRELTVAEQQALLTAYTTIENDLLATTSTFYQQNVYILKKTFDQMREQNRWIA